MKDAADKLKEKHGWQGGGQGGGAGGGAEPPDETTRRNSSASINKAPGRCAPGTKLTGIHAGAIDKGQFGTMSHTFKNCLLLTQKLHPENFPLASIA